MISLSSASVAGLNWSYNPLQVLLDSSQDQPRVGNKMVTKFFVILYTLLYKLYMNI